MAGNLSSQAQMKLAMLQAMADKIQHVYGMVERFAATRDPRQAEMLAQPLKRAFGRLKIELMGAGLDTLSQLSGSMEIAAGRGASHHQKTRILREGVGSLRFQMEQEQKKVVTEDREAQARAEREQAEQAKQAERPEQAERAEEADRKQTGGPRQQEGGRGRGPGPTRG